MFDLYYYHSAVRLTIINNSGVTAQLIKYATSGMWKEKPSLIADGANAVAEVVILVIIELCNSSVMLLISRKIPITHV